MKVYIESKNKELEIEIKKKKKIKELLKELGVLANTVILVKNDSICLEDEEIGNKDSLKLLSVVSGG